MSAYELSRVLEKWDREELTSEQAIGQLLLLVESLNRRVGGIERRLERLRSGAAGTPVSATPKAQLPLVLEKEENVETNGPDDPPADQKTKGGGLSDDAGSGGAPIVGPRPVLEQLWLA